MTASRFIGVVCGLKSEEKAVGSVRLDERLRVAVSGANAMRAEALAVQLINDGAVAVLSVGVSGGLSPHLSPGDLIVGEAVKTKSGEDFPANDSLLSAIGLRSGDVAIERSILFGSDEIVATSRHKSVLFENYHAAAVDMESHGVARAARNAGVPFAAIRAIADPASRALPPAALNAIAADGSTRTLPVLWACAKAPGQFPALLQLGADSEKALRSLRVNLRELFLRLFLALDL